MKVNIFYLTAGALCLLYYILIFFYAGAGSDFSWIWLFFGALFLAGFFLHGRARTSAAAHVLYRIYFVLMCAGFSALLIVMLRIGSQMRSQGPGKADYVIVLGAQVHGTRPSRSLRLRLDKAQEYAERHPSAQLILTGGQGPGEDITEAECMREDLVSREIDESRLILEDRSTSTEENLTFADRLTGCADETCGIITNDFHVYRALRLAKLMGYSDVSGIAARSDGLLEVHFLVREAFALVATDLRTLIFDKTLRRG